MMTEQEFKEYYSNLLIIQYHGLTNAKATIEALVQQAYVNNLFVDIRDAFNIDTAVGDQLDILGMYIGVTRAYQIQEFDDDCFGFITYDEVDSPPTDRQGFTNYTDFDTSIGWTLQYQDIVSTTVFLDDTAYRTILKLKIIQNNCNHSHKIIDDSLFAFFGENIVASSAGKMDIVYFIKDVYFELAKVALQKNIFPKPMGVRIDAIDTADIPYFGFITYDEVDNPPEGIEGFSDYTDFETKIGQTLTYNNFIEV